MIAGALVFGFLGSLGNKEIEVGIGGSVFTISIGAIGGAFVQYLLFH